MDATQKEVPRCRHCISSSQLTQELQCEFFSSRFQDERIQGIGNGKGIQQIKRNSALARYVVSEYRFASVVGIFRLSML